MIFSLITRWCWSGGRREEGDLHVPPLAGQTLQQSSSRRTDSRFPLAVFLVVGPRVEKIAAKLHFSSVRAATLSASLPELQAVAGLGVLQLGVLVVSEGGPLCGLLSLESVDPPIERTVGQVIVYSSLQ